MVHVEPSARIVMASTLSLYNLDGTLDCPRHLADLKWRRRAHLALTILAGSWLVIELTCWASLLALPIVLGFSMCALYAVRLVLGGRQVRLKAIPGLKGPFIGWAVGTAVLLAPWLVYGPKADPPPLLPSLALLFGVSSFCTANAMLFDFPDLTDDRRLGVPTIVSRAGLRSAKRTCASWIAIGIGATVFVDARARTPLAVLGVALVVALRLVHPTSRKATLALWVDGALTLSLIVRILLDCGA